MLCPKCNKEFDSKFCPSCGYSAETTENTNQASPSAPSVPAGQQPAASYQPPPIIINNNNTANAVEAGRPGSLKHKWIAFFLCLLLGPIGGHRFYVGKIGSALLYCCSMGFLGIGIAIDLFMILMGSFTDKQGNFLV